MDESPEPSQNDDPSTISASDGPLPELVTVAPRGDLVLDVTFETSPATLKAARKTAASNASAQRLKPRVRLAYRVDRAALAKHSRYFANLLGDTRFAEARAVAARLAELSLRDGDDGGGGGGEHEHDPADLPRVRIVDDDEATRATGRERALADMLRLLHGQPATATGATPTPNNKPATTMLYVATLAVLADRFACAAAVARALAAGLLRVRWPATPPPVRLRDDDGLAGLSLAAEEVVRQKLLVAWLLDQPPRFAAATRELVVYGSHRWADVRDDNDDDESEGDEGGGGGGALDPGRDAAAASRQEALWWYLPDGLEEELHHRRHRLLRTLASVPAHFLSLYTATRGAASASRRQCKLGYDTSAACDSFQLGEMVKFLVAKRLLFLTTPLLPTSSGGGGVPPKELAAVDLHSILAALKQCPHYQLDRHHTNCGMRTRLMPILEYLASMLSANAVPLGLAGWKKDPKRTSWASSSSSSPAEEDKNRPAAAAAAATASAPPVAVASAGRRKKKDFVVPSSGNDDERAPRPKKKGRVFLFTRSVASDQRLRHEGAMAADRMARELFTADDWDWTPEEDTPARISTTPFLGFK